MDALEEVAFRLGFDERSSQLLCQTLRITMRRLRGYATLNRRSERPTEIRRPTGPGKVFHPDRHPLGTPRPRRRPVGCWRGSTKLARTCSGRSKTKCSQRDDLWLDEPFFESEDAPTEDYTATCSCSTIRPTEVNVGILEREPSGDGRGRLALGGADVVLVGRGRSANGERRPAAVRGDRPVEVLPRG